MGIEIETGIPLPPPTCNRRRPPYRRVVGHGELKQTLARLENLQSFLYPENRKHSIYKAARAIAVRVSIRPAEDKPGFVRAWRNDIG